MVMVELFSIFFEAVDGFDGAHCTYHPHYRLYAITDFTPRLTLNGVVDFFDFLEAAVAASASITCDLNSLVVIWN